MIWKSLCGFLLGGFLSLILASCQSSNDSVIDVQAELSQKYFQTARDFEVKVIYESDAAPLVGTTTNGHQVWNILKDNLDSIFQYKSQLPTVTVPTTLAGMTSIPSNGKTSWTVSDLKTLHAAHVQATDTDSMSYFHIYFVRGYFNDGSSNQTGTIGVSIGGTTFVTIFKDVVENAAASTPVRRFVEQSTIVHELGHALGFVNNGVPMAVAHQDTAHGAHSTNEDCVMYWLNEGASDMVAFIQKFIASSSYVMWGPEVLADAQAYSK